MKKLLPSLSMKAYCLLLELAVGALGAFLLWSFIETPFARIRFSLELDDIKMGFLYLLPTLLILFFATDPRHDWPVFDQLRKDIENSGIKSLILESKWPYLLLLSIVAGVGEELAFRAFLQTQIGLIGASIIFGAFHYLSFTYFAITTLLGLYLGWVYQYTGSGFWVVAIIHAVYDFLGLLLYKRQLASERT